jgi:hypothetical protein
VFSTIPGHLSRVPQGYHKIAALNP